MSDGFMPPSFTLAGEGLWQIGGAELAEAARSYAELHARIAPRLRDAFARERTRFRRVVGDILDRYNTSLERRIEGYARLGEAVHWEYPWPVVAILGLQNVRRGLVQQASLSILGRLAGRHGVQLHRIADTISDLLRRTNRGIFNDSVPAVILALRAHELRRLGQQALAEALVHGPRPLAMDAHAQHLATGLYGALAIDDGQERFRSLAALTLRHFEREQTIFTHHLGSEPAGRSVASSRWMTWIQARQRRLSAPCVMDGRLVFRPYRLPPDFDIRDHGARVQEFGRAFVCSVTGAQRDYRIAAAYVRRRRGIASPMSSFDSDGAPTPDWQPLSVCWGGPEP